MVFTWYGQACFRIQAKTPAGGEVSVVIDPYGEIGLKLPKLTADLLLITHDHDDHSNKAAVLGNPFVISGPGEYEVKGVAVIGTQAPHDKSGGSQRGFVTMYTVTVEGITIVHLGDLGTTELTEAQTGAIDEPDVLLLPVGGAYTIDGKEAASLVSHLEPRVVIPMHYQLPGLKYKLDGVTNFLKHVGGKEGENLEKLRLTKKDLPQEETRVVLLSAAA